MSNTAHTADTSTVEVETTVVVPFTAKGTMSEQMDSLAEHLVIAGSKGNKYLKKYIAPLAYGVDKAIKRKATNAWVKGERKGFVHDAKAGRYLITKNTTTNLLYASFKSWEQVRAEYAIRQEFSNGL